MIRFILKRWYSLIWFIFVITFFFSGSDLEFWACLIILHIIRIDHIKE